MPDVCIGCRILVGRRLYWGYLKKKQRTQLKVCIMRDFIASVQLQELCEVLESPHAPPLCCLPHRLPG